MIFIGNFNKNSFISAISVTKQKNFVVFASTYVSRNPTLLLRRFLHEFVFCWQRWSDEAMKQGDEALNALSFQFLRSVKRFIALSLQIFAQR